MKLFKDKQGNKLTFKQFMDRWKSGIENTTPYQKVKVQILGTRITIIGILLGLFVSIYGYKNLWWVGIMMVGALINTGVQYLGLVQQRKIFEKIEEELKEQDNNSLINGKSNNKQ
jgi:hypothetical protein